MRTDPRCSRLSALSAEYQERFAALTERYLQEEMQACGIDGRLCLGDFTLLNAVAEQKGKAIMADMAKQLGIIPSTATRQVNRLASYALVCKAPVPRDERCYEIRLTELGQ